SEGPFAKRTVLHKVVLLKSCKRGLVSPSDPQRAVGKNALGVVNVSQNFFHRPLSRRIPEISVPLAAPRKQLQHLHTLRFKNSQNVSSGNFRYVGPVKLGVLRRFGSVHGDSSILGLELYRSDEPSRTRSLVRPSQRQDQPRLLTNLGFLF